VRHSRPTASEIFVPPSTPGLLETLTVGSRVFYPGHGVVSVVGTEERTFSGEVQRFYILRLETDRPATLLLPVGKVAQGGIRPMISAAKAKALLKLIAEKPVFEEVKSDPASRKHRVAGYSEALRSGSPDRYTAALSELLSRFRSGKLPPSEQQTLVQALAMFIGEVSAAQGRTLEEVRAELRAAGELPPTGWTP
jgi:RNA polymerase-interacting CarD/CdnL/TRCF family regulator